MSVHLAGAVTLQLLWRRISRSPHMLTICGLGELLMSIIQLIVILLCLLFLAHLFLLLETSPPRLSLPIYPSTDWVSSNCTKFNIFLSIIFNKKPPNCITFFSSISLYSVDSFPNNGEFDHVRFLEIFKINECMIVFEKLGLQ